MVRMTVSSQLEKIHAARAKLDKEEQLLLAWTHDKALAQIVKIARQSFLSSEQIIQAFGSKNKSTQVSTVSKK